MIINATNPETGEKIEIDAPDLSQDELESLIKSYKTVDEIHRYLNNLDISADAKILLSKILNTTMKVGGKIIEIGKKVLEIIIDLAGKYPNTTFGLVAALLVTALVSSIPLFGYLFGLFISPLLIAFGLVAGFSADMKDSSITDAVAEAMQAFSPLKGAKA